MPKFVDVQALIRILAASPLCDLQLWSMSAKPQLIFTKGLSSLLTDFMYYLFMCYFGHFGTQNFYPFFAGFPLSEVKNVLTITVETKIFVLPLLSKSSLKGQKYY